MTNFRRALAYRRYLHPAGVLARISCVAQRYQQQATIGSRLPWATKEIRSGVALGQHFALAGWLLLLALALAGAGQWFLTQEQDVRGWGSYLAGGGLLLAALRMAHGGRYSEEEGTDWVARAWRWLPLVIFGQGLALFLTRSGETSGLVILAWSLSLLAAIAGIAPRPAIGALWRSSSLASERLAVGGVIALAALLRLVNLEGIPSGVHGDEGEFGTIALDVLHGQGPPLFGIAFLGDPALYPHLLAPFVALLGANMTAIRLLSAIIGTLTVLLFYLFIRDLGGARAGLIAAILLSGSAVHIHFSRLALNVIEAPFFVCLSLWFLWKGLVRQRAIWFLVAGLAGGLGWYFHFSARMIAPLLGVILLWQLLARQLTLAQTIRGGVLTALGSLLGLAPFLRHTLAEPGQLSDHVNGRLLWNTWADAAATYHTSPGDWGGVLGGQANATLAAFFQRPDNDAFFGFGGTPLLSVIVAPLAFLGLCALCLRPRSRTSSILLSWFLVPFICGSVLVVSAGAFHRLLIALLPALGAAALLIDRLITLLSRWRPLRIGPVMAGTLLLLAPMVVAHDAQRYFGPIVAAYPWADSTSQARQLQSLPPGTVAYVLAAPFIYADHGTSRYLGQAIERHDLYNPTVTLPGQPAGHPLVILISPGNQALIPLVRAYFPQARVDEIRWPNGQTVQYRLNIAPGEHATIPEAGLRGEIQPAQGTPLQVRQDPALAFLNLDELGGGTSYAARWSGRLQPPQPGSYRLEVVTNGTITLRLDGVPIVADPAATTETDLLTMPLPLETRGYDFQIAGNWVGGGGYLILYWRKDGGERELVPPAAFLGRP